MGSIAAGPRRTWRALAVALVAAVALAVAACGGDDDSSTQTAGAATAQPAVDPVVAQATKNIDALFAGQVFKQPPATSPPPQRGKNVWHINVGLSLPAGVLFADGMKIAAKELGWKMTIFDGKFSADLYQQGIRQAIADKADGIIIYTVDCSLMKAPLQQAKAAGIPVVAASSDDCNANTSTEPSLFTEQTNYLTDAGPGNAIKWAEALGRSEADWVISQTKGKAKAIVFDQKDVSYVVHANDGFQEEFRKCTTCEIVATVEHTLADIGPKLQEKAQQTILQHPEANALVLYYDDLMTGGVGPAITDSGRKDQLAVVAGGGYPQNMDSVRKDQGQDAGYAIDIRWEGLASADILNRYFAGQKPVTEGLGIGFFDHDHNLGTTGAFKVNIDYVAAYKKAWAAGAG